MGMDIQSAQPYNEYRPTDSSDENKSSDDSVNSTAPSSFAGFKPNNQPPVMTTDLGGIPNRSPMTTAGPKANPPKPDKKPEDKSPKNPQANRLDKINELQKQMDEIKQSMGLSKGTNPSAGTKTSPNEWLKRVMNGLPDKISAFGQGMVSPFKKLLNQYSQRFGLQNVKWPPNMLFSGSSGVPNHVGYMDMPGPGARSFGTRALCDSLKNPNNKDFITAFDKIAGKNIAMGGLSETPLYWMKNPSGERLQDSPFNITAPEDNKFNTKHLFLGVPGHGPVSTFQNGMNEMANIWKNKFNASTMVLNGGHAKEGDLDRVFSQLSSHIAKNPNQPFTLTLANDTHGGNQQRGFSTLNMDEAGLKRLLNKHFAKLPNVGIYFFNSSCYSGRSVCSWS